MADVAKAGKYADAHHRVRMTEADLSLIETALTHYAGGKLSPARKAEALALRLRLIDMKPGRK
jgi:hypothetical protein